MRDLFCDLIAALVLSPSSAGLPPSFPHSLSSVRRASSDMRPKLWPLSWFSRALTLTLDLTTRRPPPSPFRRLLSGVAVKKVTRSNFEQAVEELRGLVREADFVAFDLEMSGVASAPWRACTPLDDQPVRYLKAKDSAEKFAALQFGLCPFRWDPSRNSFVASPHNFYLFPRPDLPINGSSSEFLCQTSSLDFLAKHQFDFNAWIYDGITYLSRAQESEAEQALLSACEGRANIGTTLKESVEVPLVRTADILFTERMNKKFVEWRDGILKGCVKGEKPECSRNQFQTIFFKMRPAVLLDGFSSHQHKLIQLVIRTHFKDLVYIRSNAEDSLEGRMVVYSAVDGDKTVLMKEVQEDFWRITKEKIKSAAGFRHIIDLLAAEQKLIVGHSCILDIVHMHDKFLGPLPSTITEFAHSFHTLFPHVMDTKHLLESCEDFQQLVDKRGSKSLSSVFAQLCPGMPNISYLPDHKLVKIEVSDDEIGPWYSGAKHEAGYDAFMTGSVFVQACAYMGINFKLLSQPLDLSKHEKLRKYENLVCLGRKNETIVDLKTGVESPQSVTQPVERRYPKIDTANIIILWGFSPKIKTSDLKQCLSKVYGPVSVASIFYLDESAALVQFTKKELVRKFLDLKNSLERDNNVISALHPFAMLLEGGNTCAANYSVYREICSSSISKFLFTEQAEAVGIRWMTKMVTDDRVANLSNPNGYLNSTGETAEKTEHAPETKINADGGSNYLAGSYAHLSYKAILDSLYEFSRDSGSQTQVENP